MDGIAFPDIRSDFAGVTIPEMSCCGAGIANLETIGMIVKIRDVRCFGWCRSHARLADGTVRRVGWRQAENCPNSQVLANVLESIRSLLCAGARIRGVVLCGRSGR